jgi:hypothetical protein
VRPAQRDGPQWSARGPRLRARLPHAVPVRGLLTLFDFFLFVVYLVLSVLNPPVLPSVFSST